jgi:hypothetical protein
MRRTSGWRCGGLTRHWRRCRQESARPYFMYSLSTRRNGHTRGCMRSCSRMRFLLPSPLLTFASTDVLVHFRSGRTGSSRLRRCRV